MVYSFGLMEGSMKVAGKTESSMVLGSKHQPKGKQRKENGKKENAISGYRE